MIFQVDMKYYNSFRKRNEDQDSSKSVGCLPNQVQTLLMRLDIQSLDPNKLSMKDVVWDLPIKLSSESDLKADDYIEFFGSNLDINTLIRMFIGYPIVMVKAKG